MGIAAATRLPRFLPPWPGGMLAPAGGLAALTAAGFLLWAAPRPDPPASPGTGPEPPAAFGEQVAAMEYRVSAQARPACAPANATGLVLQAPNRAQNLRTCFTAGGVHVVRRTGDVTWRWGLALAFHGSDGALQAAAAAEPLARGNRVEYHRGALTEWYVNDPQGLEQGFTLHEPLTTTAETLLRIAVSGDLKPRADSDGVVFHGANDAPVIDYRKLVAWDARQRPLAATMTATAGGIEIRVATAGAEYPVTVDPLATTATWTAESNHTEALFGYSVASAGDVNGDGYSDVIVGAPYFDNGQDDEGRAWVFHGGPDGLSPTPAWFVESNQANARLGQAVATAGDVNGDGYSDVIIGAPGFSNGQAGEGRAFVYHGGPSGLAATPAWFVESDQAGAGMGFAVGTAGDVNGDGYADVIVSAPAFTQFVSGEGRVYVYHGGPAGLAGLAAWTRVGNAVIASLGFSVGTAGDVNGDGYADVIVGAPGFSNGHGGEGVAYVFHGSATGLGIMPAWTTESNQPGAEYGTSVATAGDFNGDGYADVVVGAPLFDHPFNADAGAVFLYLGGQVGLQPTTEPWFSLGGTNPWGWGYTVAPAGDVNGDGLGDFLVGSPYRGVGGFVTVVPGNATLNFLFTTFPRPLAAQAGAQYGWSAATAGDVNGDGYSDVIVGAPRFDNGQIDEGMAFVYMGGGDGPYVLWGDTGGQTNLLFSSPEGDAGEALAGVGDVNGDGFDDVVVGAPNSDEGSGRGGGRIYLYHGSPAGAQPGWQVGIDQAFARFGASVAGAGDTNGDGYADVIAGAPGGSLGLAGEGFVHFYFGSPSGLDQEEWVGRGNQALARYGWVVSGAGDVNGDGYADMLVTAPWYDNGQEDEGRVYVYHGGPGGPSVTPAWTAESNQAGALFGFSAAAAGDVNGDGYGDIIVGAPEYDNGQLNEGRAYVYYGGPGGLAANPGWVKEADEVNARYGTGVAAAGDVNGDVYADVLMRKGNGDTFLYLGSAAGPEQGAIWMLPSTSGAVIGAASGAGDINGDGFADILIGYPTAGSQSQSQEGEARIFYGSAEGPVAAVSSLRRRVLLSPDTPRGAWFGFAVAPAGDVNGDGSADFLVGGPTRDEPGDAQNAVVSIYYGHGGLDGQTYRPAQRTTAGTAGVPIAPLGLTRSLDRVRLSLSGRSPFGTGRARLEYEVKPYGVPFDGLGTVKTPDWIPTGIAGAEFAAEVTGLAPGTLYRWRARLLFDPVRTPLLPASRWMTLAANGPNEPDFRTERDTDGDGVFDSLDNCVTVPNPDQRDSNFDGYGNLCDADLNDDGLVNFTDLAIFRAVFGTANPHADFDGSGTVNFTDLAIFRALFGRPPGPSAVLY